MFVRATKRWQDGTVVFAEMDSRHPNGRDICVYGAVTFEVYPTEGIVRKINSGVLEIVDSASAEPPKTSSGAGTENAESLAEAMRKLAESRRAEREAAKGANSEDLQKLFADMPIERLVDFGVSGITNHALRTGGISTVSELIAKTDDELINVRGLGRSSIDKIRAALTELIGSVKDQS